MSDKPCPFCKSKDIMVTSPYFDKSGKRIADFCCEGQRRNHKYMATYDNPDERPDREEVEKW